MLDKLKSVLQDPAARHGVRDLRSRHRRRADRLSRRAGFRAAPRGRACRFAAQRKRDRRGCLRADGSVAHLRPQKRKEVALILPDFCTRIAVLDFDSFPSEPKEQASLIRFRVKRSLPFDAESAALSYFAQPALRKHIDVVAVLTPQDIVARYEAPFRAAGLNPGLVTTSSMAALELAPEAGLSVMAKITGRVITVLVREKSTLKLVRCLEIPSTRPGRYLRGARAHIGLRGRQSRRTRRAPALVRLRSPIRGSAAPLRTGIRHRSGDHALAARRARRKQRGSAGISAVHREEQLA